jgi:hypothetical protein
MFFSEASWVNIEAKASISGLSFSLREWALIAGSMQTRSSRRSSISSASAR